MPTSVFGDPPFGEVQFAGPHSPLPETATPNQAGGYLGTVSQGRRLPLLVRTLGPGRVPALPASPPYVALYDATGVPVLGLFLPALAGASGVFGMGVRLGGPVVPGRYCALYRYSLGEANLAVLEFFDVVAGDVAGAVISTFAYDRPEARYVLAQLDGGQLMQGTNPEF